MSTKFQAVSSKYYNFTNIQSIKSFLAINLNKIEMKLSELHMYLGQNTRQKREIADGLGSVLKWLIGTLDANDAKHYEDCIGKLEKHELDLTDLMTKQIQITSSTIKNFNETISKITYDEEIINENIKRLDNFMNSTTKLILNIKASEEISTISLQILELVLSLENEIDDCFNSILFAKSNIVHPSIISTSQLLEQLLASSNLRSNNKLIAPITMNNIHTILDSSALTAYVYSNRLVYILEFPLVPNDPLTLYHIYSIPIQHPDSSLFSTILPEHIYLATNPSGQQYISTSSLDSCKTYATGKKICRNLAIYDVDTRPTCEIKMLFSTTSVLPEICTTSTFPAQINTFQSLNNNNWLYILSKPTPCVLQCYNEASHHNLLGAGLISLPQGCKLHTGQTTLVAFHANEINISYPIIVPDIRTDDCYEDSPEDLKHQKLIPITINEMPLDNLNQIKHHIDKYNEELKKLKSSNFINSNTETFSYIYFAIGLFGLGYIMYRCCNRRSNRIMDVNIPQRRRNGCIQIFNNCFGSRKSHNSHIVAIPMTARNTTCISEDEDDAAASASSPPSPKSLGKNAQSLF